MVRQPPVHRNDDITVGSLLVILDCAAAAHGGREGLPEGWPPALHSGIVPSMDHAPAEGPGRLARGRPLQPAIHPSSGSRLRGIEGHQGVRGQ
jgi:hypothetical protein